MKNVKEKGWLYKIKLGLVFLTVSLTAFLVIYNVVLLNQKEEITGAGDRLTYYDDGYTHSFVYNEKNYMEKADISTVLVMGVDKFGEAVESVSYLNNYQSDFIALVVINNTEKTINILHINRDTMTDVRTLGVTGEYAGTVFQQLALAHTYGKGLQDSCVNTVKTVSAFLGGIKIDNYISMQMDAVVQINDLAGGVSLPLLSDFTWLNPLMTKGSTYTLKGDEALAYVRTRQNVDDGTNLARMQRQRQYIYGLYSQLEKSIEENENLLSSIYAKIMPYVISDLTINQISEKSSDSEKYTLSQIYSLSGTAKVGKNGFMEFYPEENGIYDFLTHTMFEEEIH